MSVNFFSFSFFWGGALLFSFLMVTVGGLLCKDVFFLFRIKTLISH